ncbi:MAG: GNAT family N-acetyltransferase [Candidatus Zixiibacteriota bacterium]
MKTETTTIDDVLIALRRISRAIDLHSRHLMRTCRLTGPQLVVLTEITRSSPLTLGELAKKVTLSNATITGIIDRLQIRGLVKRTRADNDRRRIIISITDAGREIIASSPPLLQEEFVENIERLPEADRHRMLDSLRLVARMMGADDLDASPILAGHALGATDQDMSRYFNAQPNGSEQKKGELHMEVADTELLMHEIHGLDQFPEHISPETFAEFMYESLKPYEDPLPEVRQAINDAFVQRGERTGYIILAEQNRKPVGGVIMLSTGMKGYIPEIFLVMVAVDPSMRGKGLGGKIIKRALDIAGCPVKLHVEYENPAKRLYERIGFSSKYAEMRYQK